MHAIAVNLVPDLFGQFVNLGRGPPMASTQRGQGEGLVGLTHSEVEPPANVPQVRISRPAVERQLNALLLDVDEASICQSPLGEFDVHAHRTPKAIHGVQKLICPLHHVRIPRDNSAFKTRVPVYLDLLEIAVVWFKMSSKSVN